MFLLCWQFTGLVAKKPCGMRKFLAFLFILTNLSACAGTPSSSFGELKFRKLEQLYAYQVMESHVEITVISTGCTSFSDFIVVSEQVENQCQLAIYRVEPDLCKRSPMPTTLEVPWKKTLNCQQDAEVVVINELINRK